MRLYRVGKHCTYACAPAYLSTIKTCIYICTHTHMHNGHVHMCIYVYMYIYVSPCYYRHSDEDSFMFLVRVSFFQCLWVYIVLPPASSERDCQSKRPHPAGMPCLRCALLQIATIERAETNTTEKKSVPLPQLHLPHHGSLTGKP